MSEHEGMSGNMDDKMKGDNISKGMEMMDHGMDIIEMGARTK